MSVNLSDKTTDIFFHVPTATSDVKLPCALINVHLWPCGCGRMKIGYFTLTYLNYSG